jgi:hypothetical protein
MGMVLFEGLRQFGAQYQRHADINDENIIDLLGGHVVAFESVGAPYYLHPFIL